jgi:hypothetical protein
MTMPLTGQLYRHKKTGNIYKVILADCRIEATNTEAVAYQRVLFGMDRHELTTVVWVRPFSEFVDGRFEHVTGNEGEAL